MTTKEFRVLLATLARPIFWNALVFVIGLGGSYEKLMASVNSKADSAALTAHIVAEDGLKVELLHQIQGLTAEVARLREEQARTVRFLCQRQRTSYGCQ